MEDGVNLIMEDKGKECIHNKKIKLKSLLTLD